jgi:hypothetical protein
MLKKCGNKSGRNVVDIGNKSGRNVVDILILS